MTLPGVVDDLVAVLHASRAQGFLGPGPVEAHIEHTSGFAQAVEPGTLPVRALDLGSGGGPPGLVLAATVWPDTEWILLEAAARRCSFLIQAVATLELSSRVVVLRGRAEEFAHKPTLRGSCDLVVARSFGSPGVTAECGIPFLAPDGCAVVSEPPGGRPQRWDPAALARLGARYERPTVTTRHAFAVLRRVAPCPDRYPRRTGIPSKRPLF